ncbi:MAG: GAF domain-containing protein [candidate division KSB1 bacterium]|nr:GAF domain-containing protein [candidate division KSB1 bacterium]
MAKLIQKLNPLQVLNRLMDTIQSTDSIIEIFAEADQLIRQMIRCDQIYFLLNNDKARHFYVNHALNFGDRESAQDIVIPYNSTSLTEILQSCRSIRRHDLSGRGQLTPGDLKLLPPGTQSDLSVPIINKHEVLAIMNLSSHQPHFFTKAQQLFAEQVALLLGFAMARSHLLEKLTVAQTELFECENKLACITRHMHEALVIIRPDYDLIYDVNPAFERLSGYSAAELQTMRLSALHPQYADLVRPQFNIDATNGHHLNEIKLTLTPKNGEAILVSLHLAKPSSPDQRFLYLFYQEITASTPTATAEEHTITLASEMEQPPSEVDISENEFSPAVNIWKEIDAIVTSSDGLIDKIRSVLVTARHLLPFDYLQFDLFDASGENIRRFSLISQRCRLLDSKQSWQALPESDLFWSGIEEKPLAQVIHESARAIEKEIRSSIPLPLLVHDQYSGMLVVGSLEAGCYLPADIQFAEQIAHKISCLIESEQVNQNSPPGVAIFDPPVDVLSQIASSLSLEQVLQHIVHAAASAWHASLATIRLLEEGEPSPGAIFSRPDVEQKLVGQFEKHIVLPQLLITDAPMVTAPIGNGTVTREALALLDATPLRSYLAVPIRAKQSVVAILSIYWEKLHSLTVKEIRFLELLSKLSACAINNAQIHEAVLRDCASVQHQQLALQEFANMTTETLGGTLTKMQGIHAALCQEFLPEINQEAYHCLQQIQCHAATAQCVVRAWHEFSSLVQTPMSFEEINVAEIIKQAIHELRPKLVQRNIDIIIEEVLPLVNGDRERLRQVFFHLIDMAIGQLKNCTVQPKIEIGHRTIDSGDQFFIRNNGPAAHYLPRKGHFQLFDCLCQDE